MGAANAGCSVVAAKTQHPRVRRWDVLTRFVALVDLDADQMRFGAEPVHPADPALPIAAHARAALLVRLGDATLPRGSPHRARITLGGHTGHERRVRRVEHVEVRQRYRGRRLALATAFADEEARR